NFEGASEDGQHVIFTSTQKLTNGAVDGTASGDASAQNGCQEMTPGTGGCNLYEYSQANGSLKLIAGGEVLGVVGIAEDGSHTYFVSRSAILSAGTNEFGSAPKAEQPNLYAYDATSQKTAFIATLSAAD